MFSTLLPTLVHLSLALLALALHYPAGWRNFVAGLLERGAQSRQASFLSGVCICAMITLAVWVPIWIIAAVVTHDNGATLNAVLWSFCDLRLGHPGFKVFLKNVERLFRFRNA